MKLLLDTHVWIWAALYPQRLNNAVKRQLSRGANTVFVSPVSIWEAEHIHKKGKLRIKQPFAEWIDSVVAQTAVMEMPYTIEVAKEAAGIHLPQPDFADTVLAATARVFDLVLVTQDAQLLNCKWLKTLAND